MQPVRMALRATHWKYVTTGSTIMTPCAPTDQDAIQVSMMDLKPEQILLPPLTQEHFESSLKRIRPSVGKSELEMQERFTKLYGIPGQITSSAVEEEQAVDEQQFQQENAKNAAEELEFKSTDRLAVVKQARKTEKHVDFNNDSTINTTNNKAATKPSRTPVLA